MSKYSNELKLKVIERYKKYASLKKIVNHFNIPSIPFLLLAL